VAAAEKAGIGLTTLYRWLREPGFRAAYQRARQQLLERTVGRLLSVCSKVVDALEANLASSNPAARNRAAAVILANAVKGVETLDLAERLASLEQLAQWEKT
jgi:hypothetical protein